MWKKEGLAWISDLGQKESVAPRPHGLTLLIGLMAPLIAVVALVISLRSLNLGENSMKIGQRAYLNITKGEVTIKPSDVPPHGNDVRIDVSYNFDINNLGNTPAQI